MIHTSKRKKNQNIFVKLIIPIDDKHVIKSTFLN